MGVPLVISDWLADHPSMKGEWNCVLVIPGALSVTISGMKMMLVWFVPNLTIHEQVRKCRRTFPSFMMQAI